MMQAEHKMNNQEGTEYVRSVLQQKYWIIGLRNALRRIKRNCVLCRKHDIQTLQPQMAGLPQQRVEDRIHPFTNTGIKYFGPFELKLLRRTMKRWCCLFTCLSTRAGQIKMAHSLDAGFCLAAISRFVARRGNPCTILSDNGLNFVGAAKEIKHFIENLNKQDIADHLTQKEIEWSMNPPGAPHFGGVWERLVKSCKRAMVAVLVGRSMSDEVLTTKTCFFEQTLNARPLTAASNDPEDLEALTPNHFLFGRSSIAIPFIPNATNYADMRKAFKTSQSYADMIWTRWITKYRPE